MAESIEMLNLRLAQQQQIMGQYRVDIYTHELKFGLLIKMLQEKGMMVKDEFDKRWPIYLKNDVGVIGQDGVMEGSIRVNFYWEK